MNNFYSELVRLINRYSKDNEARTPDHLLAEFLVGCLATYMTLTEKREQWLGRSEVQQ